MIRTQSRPLPYLTAEVGGGNQDTYHRRPVIQPMTSRHVPGACWLGRDLYGTYMFQAAKTLTPAFHAPGIPGD